VQLAERTAHDIARRAQLHGERALGRQALAGPQPALVDLALQESARLIDQPARARARRLVGCAPRSKGPSISSFQRYAAHWRP